MHNFYKTIKMIAAVAALGAVVMTSTAQPARAQAAGGGQPAAQAAGGQPAAQPQKKYKDQGEYDIYNEVTKDLAAQNWTKAVTDLDTWKQKYPESDFKDTRTLLYVTAYNGAKQFPKVVDTAAGLLDRGPDQVFNDPKTGPRDVVQLLFSTSVAIQQIPNPTPEQLATGQKAAKELLDYNKKPEGVSDADWNTARTQLQAVAKQALLSIAVLPGNQAMAKNAQSKDPADCQAAADAFTKALEQYPDQSFIAYNLGRAYNCVARAKPDQATEVAPKAIYEFVRAAVLDPTLGKTTDAKKITDYADQVYRTYHGDDSGLAELKEQVKNSPLPPAGFTIESATAVATRKQNEFKEKYPQLALWLGVKSLLADPANGTQYFEGTLKGSAVPKLKGVVVEGKPACRSKEVLVAIPLPDQQGTARPEVTLKLDAPLTGKPEAGTEIQWEGVPSAFTQDPFMLTMDTEKAKIDNLKVSPCAPTPARAPARRGGAAKKK